MGEADDHLLHLEEISSLTQVPVNTLRYWRHRGEGPKTFRVGRRVVAWRSDVVAWLKTQEDESGAGG